MFIAHLPAGYIVSRLLLPRFASRGAALKPFLSAAALGAVAPDLDMIYFYLIDDRQHNHHTYLTHFPIAWIGLLLMSAAWLHTGRAGNRAPLAIIFALNGFLHMLLDSIVGRIWWLAPFSDKSFTLFTVPALYDPWWLSFLLHWSLALELAIVMWAVYLWRRRRLHPCSLAEG